MTFRIARPSTMSPSALDALLARGWYRMRQAVFTCRYLLAGGNLHAAVWTRLDLKNFTFRRGLRRRMRRIERVFDVRIQPAIVDEDREALYQRYRAHVGGDRANRLRDVLYDDDNRDVFDTQSVEIWLDDRLVAFSYFDLGEHSLQSVIGVYDPELSKYGLGFMTMLFEIQYGIDHGYSYHYSGYVMPGVPVFDYKQDVGELEYYSPDEDTWALLQSLQPETLPAHRLRVALGTTSEKLADSGIENRVRTYPPYRAVQASGLQSCCLAQPQLVELEVGSSQDGNVFFAITYDPIDQEFAFDVVRRAQDLRGFVPDGDSAENEETSELRMLVRLRRLATEHTADQMATVVTSMIRRGLAIRERKS